MTPAIASLADDITRGKTKRREQAEAIFDWVTGNIRYLAVVIGVGRVVPNAPETVIANRYGDCKDVAQGSPTWRHCKMPFGRFVWDSGSASRNWELLAPT